MLSRKRARLSRSKWEGAVHFVEMKVAADLDGAVAGVGDFECPGGAIDVDVEVRAPWRR